MTKDAKARASENKDKTDEPSESTKTPSDDDSDLMERLTELVEGCGLEDKLAMEERVAGTGTSTHLWFFLEEQKDEMAILGRERAMWCEQLWWDLVQAGKATREMHKGPRLEKLVRPAHFDEIRAG